MFCGFVATTFHNCIITVVTQIVPICCEPIVGEIYVMYQSKLEEVGPIGINHMRFNIAIENLVRDAMATH